MSAIYVGSPFFPTRKKVLDHRRFSGKVTGAVHNYCNLQYAVKNRFNWKLFVLMHNFSRFDSKVLIKAVQEDWARNERIPTTWNVS